MAAPWRQKGSFSDIGYDSIGCDKDTKARLKALCGDRTIIETLRDLVEQGEERQRQERGGQGALPGKGMAKDKLAEAEATITRFNAFLSSIMAPEAPSVEDTVAAIEESIKYGGDTRMILEDYRTRVLLAAGVRLKESKVKGARQVELGFETA